MLLWLNCHFLYCNVIILCQYVTTICVYINTNTLFFPSACHTKTKDFNSNKWVIIHKRMTKYRSSCRFETIHHWRRYLGEGLIPCFRIFVYPHLSFITSLSQMEDMVSVKSEILIGLDRLTSFKFR